MSTKVLHVISSLKRGGRERQLCTIYRNSDPGVQSIKVIYFNDRYPNYIDEFNLNSGSLIKIKSKGTAARIMEIYKTLRQEKPRVVYTWGNLEYFLSMLVRPFLGFTLINGSVRHGITLKKWSHLFRTAMLHLSGNIIANSRAGLRANGLRRGEVLYNGIDSRFFNHTVTDAEVLALRGQLRSPVFISVANLVPYKDYFTVIDVMAKLRSKGFNFSYLIIGEGPMRQEVEARIDALEMQDVITLLGSKGNVEDYLAVSDVFIHSSKGEGCSNAILEAMASGLPVIASKVGGTPEIVREEFGRLFEYQDAGQLADCLESLLEEQSQIEEMGRKAREEAVAKYSVDAMMNNYYQVIERIAGTA